MVFVPFHPSCVSPRPAFRAGRKPQRLHAHVIYLYIYSLYLLRSDYIKLSVFGGNGKAVA